MAEKVLVTGASGFIAQHIVKLLISKNYDVVGTVRSEAKGKKLQKNLSGGPGHFTYVLVPDIASNGAFEGVFKENPDISVVLHTASPFFYDTTDPEKDLIFPAIAGTRNIMKAIADHVESGKSQIKRVVVTSSDAALYSAEDEQNPTLSFDETSWNNISHEEAVKDPISAYYGAKSFAEKIAWEFAAKPGFPLLSSVNPVYVFGPQAFENEVSEKLNTSNEVINALLSLGPDGSFDNDKGGFIDVRDVARAHLAAFEEEKSIGKRLYLTNGKFSVQMMVDVIHNKFPELSSRVPLGSPGSGPKDISTLAKTNNDATRKLLGFQFIALDECVGDVVQQILEDGFKISQRDFMRWYSGRFCNRIDAVYAVKLVDYHYKSVLRKAGKGRKDNVKGESGLTRSYSDFSDFLKRHNVTIFACLCHAYSLLKRVFQLLESVGGPRKRQIDCLGNPREQYVSKRDRIDRFIEYCGSVISSLLRVERITGGSKGQPPLIVQTSGPSLVASMEPDATLKFEKYKLRCQKIANALLEIYNQRNLGNTGRWIGYTCWCDRIPLLK
ncbi:hypothetical protein JCM33374_g881 [Metschnikowia sp. JCM 33374]|nr:hypothetical protein JCM33374_g881 [Metschnikowia sp. JCM 33374]